MFDTHRRACANEVASLVGVEAMKGRSISRVVAIAAKRAALCVAELAYAACQRVLTGQLTRRRKRGLGWRRCFHGRGRGRFFCASKSRQRDEGKGDAKEAHEPRA